MPNWCQNSLNLVCSSKEEADEIEALMELVAPESYEGDKTFFGHFVPETWEKDNDNESDAMPAWYMWRVNNWGTKWDANLYHWNRYNDTGFMIHFDTAWGPQTEVYHAAVDQGYDVSASYYEPGMCFVGSWITDCEAEHYEYSDCDTPEQVRELIGDWLDDEWDISQQWQEMLDEEAEMENWNNDSGVEDFGKA